MKLFDDFEAVKFPEENMILVTHMGYIYYIYNGKYKHWEKFYNAGNVHITVENYKDVTKEDLKATMHGIFPEKETDFMRLCDSTQLFISDMMNLLKEDYANYMSDYSIYSAVHRLLIESDIRYKSYEWLRKLLDDFVENKTDNQQVLTKIKELCFKIIGRDIFKKEIGIVDGHDTSSYFWIMPARVIDYTDTDNHFNVANMTSVEISIEEDDVDQYLAPFFYKHFDNELKANKYRRDANGFEWYLTHNFFTFSSITAILKDISDTIDALSSGIETEFTQKVTQYNTEIELIIDFYHRFIYRMEYMITVGKEKGYNLISIMGP